MARAVKEPGCPHQRMPREGQLEDRREDPDTRLRLILYEHRLAEAEVVRDALVVRLGDDGRLQEDAERVSTAPVGGREDVDHLELGVPHRQEAMPSSLPER